MSGSTPKQTYTDGPTTRSQQESLHHTYDVFLSHDWGVDAQGRNTHHRVAALNAALKQRGIATWFDSDQMHGNVVERMAEGIDNSECVVVCVTENYIAKAAGNGPRGVDDNVKREFDYACLRCGIAQMIPVVLEDSVRSTATWVGTVGFNLGSQLYIDASADGAMEDAAMLEAIAAKVATMCKAKSGFRGNKPPVEGKSLGQDPADEGGLELGGGIALAGV